MQADHSENTKRIAKNTIMLYIRMLFSMLVSLYTSRVVLNTLGVEDYGIYNVVGGFVTMFSLISSSLSSSVSRFLTFELGKGDLVKLKRIFSTSMWIHIALALLIFLLAESIGVWFLNTQMTIPAERMVAANWVFQASILAFMFGLFSVPYNASIVSHEKMTAFAYIGILDVVLRLCIVLFIAYSNLIFDKLIVYSLLLVAVSISLQLIYVSYCRRHFVECRLQLFFDKLCWKEMSAFASWNFIGCTAGLLKDQGVNVLMNLFVGPVLNAARGIAVSVNVAVSGFANNFMVALNPQIIKSYAADEREYMFLLIERGSRFSFYVLYVFALPLLLETDFILTIWLKQYPEHTVNFVRLILILSLNDILSNTLITVQNATGKIRNYQLVVGTVLLMNFPLSYLCLYLGMTPESVFIVALFISVCSMLLRLCFLRSSVQLPVLSFLKKVVCNVYFVAALSAIVPLVVYFSFDSSWYRFIGVSFISVINTLFIIYNVGCNQTERSFVLSKMHKLKAVVKL